MGLRLDTGLSLSRIAAVGAVPEPEALRDLADLGLIAVEGDRLVATPRGRLVLNSVIARLAGV